MEEKQKYHFKKQFFSQIYHDYIDKIYRFIYFKVNSETTAQDLTSETFSRLWKQIYLDKKVENHSAFLYRTAHNLLVDFYRSKNKNTGNLEDVEFMLADNGQNPEEEAIKNDDLCKVKKALSQINQTYAQAVSLYYIEDASVKEIAKSLNKSEGATRVLIHRGLKQLKDKIEEV